ncbi:MBL fold metallo-hydrolase [candidate division CSSED10-310 bacterium]|uniref:MBL fold metallo-hydrolase n=1 Tax=candidate division CSSED10-310 bacterium TaxID=2855610 RepID=A0ABV6YUA7_UNCC1
MKITMLGHSTLLLEMDGKRILTDPWLTDSVFWGTLRHHTPVPAPREVLPLDLMIISHGHEDHCDLKTLEKLPKTLPVVIFNRYKRIIREAGFDEVYPVKSGDMVDIGGIKVKATPGKHIGGIVTFLIQATEGKIFFGGDSELCIELEEAIKGMKPDVAVLPISGGGIGPLKFHMDPNDAARLAAASEAKVVIPSHYNLTTGASLLDRIIRKPNCLEEFKNVLATVAQGTEIKVLDVAETWES